MTFGKRTAGPAVNAELAVASIKKGFSALAAPGSFFQYQVIRSLVRTLSHARAAMRWLGEEVG